MTTVTLLELAEKEIILINNFTGSMISLEHDEDEEVVRLVQDDVWVETLPESTPVNWITNGNDHLAIIAEIRYRTYVLTPTGPCIPE